MPMAKKIAFGIFALAYLLVFLPSLTNPAALAQTASSATTGAATNVTQNSATLNGSSTFAPTEAWFNFGTTSSMGYSINATNGVGQATGLQPGKTYYYQYVARNADGTTCLGAVMSFTTAPLSCTAPVAVTNAVTNKTQNSATLNGSVSGGTPTRTWFDFGPDQSVYYSVADSGGAGQATGLQPNTTYYYRYVAQNDCGTSRGSIMSFTTLGSTPPPSNEPNVHGYHDGASGTVTSASQCVANGWATDPDSQSRAVTVNVYVDNSFNTSGVANLPRSDLTGVCPGGVCAFNIPLSITGTHTVTVKAVDNETGQEVALSGTPKTLTCSTGVTPPQVCTDPNATNYGGPLPCQYRQPPQVCTDPNATNYGGSLPCQYSTPACSTAAEQPSATTGTANVSGTSATLTGTVSANATAAWFEYGLQGGATTRANVGTGSVTLPLNNLSPGTYSFRLVAQNSCNTADGQYQTFTIQAPVCTAPTATTNQPAPGQNSATFTGTVNPQGGTATYYFAYGTNQSNLAYSTPSQTVSGNAQTVTANVTNLQSNTTYYVQLVVQNSCGSNQGQVVSFTTGGPVCTAPTAILNQPSANSQNSAYVSGTVNPNGSTVSYYFMYGTSQGSLNQFTQTFQVSGGSQNVSATLNNLQSNTTYYVQLVVQSSCGTNQSQILNFYTSGQQSCQAPSVSVNAASAVGQNYATLNGYVNPNGYATTYWFQYGTSNGFGYTSLTQGPIYNSQNVSANLYSLTNNTTYYFTLVAQSQCGTSYGQTTLTFQTGGGYIPQTQGPQAITNPATNISQTSATLNGQVNPNGAYTSAWFEWGPTQNLGQTTLTQSVGSGYNLLNISAPVSGLQPNTTYYFRVDAQNQNGTAQGQILSFTTGSSGTLTYSGPPVYNYRPPVVVVQATGPTIGGGSCLVLTPSIQPSNPIPGGDFTYSITYRNDCPFDLTNASLRNYLPNETDFSATSYPFLTRDLNVITYNLGVIPRGFQNTIMVKGLVHPNVVPGDSLVFKSDLSFADYRGQMQDVSAFLTATVAAVGGVATTGGTASILDTLLGFLSSGWFWFLLFLLLLALFILWLATRNRPIEAVEAE